MIPIYVGEDFSPYRPSIFLAGPSPRMQVTSTWRDEALLILQERDFDGDVFVPMTKDHGYLIDYKEQVRWEWRALGVASCIAFWIPRNDLYPGFTTNIEFGVAAVLRPDRVVFGAPLHASKIRYPRMMARELDRLGDAFGVELKPIHVYGTLKETLEIAHRIVRLLKKD